MKVSVYVLLVAVLLGAAEAEIIPEPSSLAYNAPRAGLFQPTSHLEKATSTNRRLSDKSESEDSSEEEEEEAEEEENEMAYTAYSAVGSALMLSVVGLFQWRRRLQAEGEEPSASLYHLDSEDGRGVQMV